MLRRLRRLDDVERDVLVRAAAIGRHFDVDLLAAVAGRSAPAVRAILERARDLQIVVPPECESYSFRHELTRDIIYAEALDGGTQAVHRRIVCVLERMRGSGQVALADLAYHAWAAGDVRRALRYNELAGDNAAAVHAADDAHAHYMRARSFIEADSADYARLSAKLQMVEQPKE